MAETLMILPRPLKCCHCGDPILLVEGHHEVGSLGEVRHDRDCAGWKPCGPVSDGTMRCPESRDGLPCQKKIPNGWHENEGHAGGHWFESDESAATRATDHIDYAVMLQGGEGLDRHSPADCPGLSECKVARWKP
ncbi:hypothetical protein [Kineosporia babensis]|uniref:Uncharacterized protein n=1 Tax=Kineosporia babensis TaxID=499548 RepID=A0A9X1NCV6_9ACTN|nr:hypothetical protein [Kineosporia babensis]MCD5310926.1 hypothetical protein [Kineosporia babensis]